MGRRRSGRRAGRNRTDSVAVGLKRYAPSLRSPWRVTETGGASQAGDFAEVLEHFPERLVPARRKRRTYVSSILSKNDVHRQGPYNRKLFLRVRHGHYLLNPGLRLRVGGQWRPIYELLDPERIGYRHLDGGQGAYDVNAALEQRLEAFRRELRALAERFAPNAAGSSPEPGVVRAGRDARTAG